jgi:hypothetical protein
VESLDQHGVHSQPHGLLPKVTKPGIYEGIDAEQVGVEVTVYRVSETSGTNGNFIYNLHCMLHMFTPTLYAFSQPLYHVCACFAQHIGIDSSTTVCSSLPTVTKIADINSILHPWRPLRSTISTLSSNIDAIFSILTFNFNL